MLKIKAKEIFIAKDVACSYENASINKEREGKIIEAPPQTDEARIKVRSPAESLRR